MIVTQTIDRNSNSVTPLGSSLQPRHHHVGRAVLAHRVGDDHDAAKLLRDKATPASPTVEFDAASVILREGKRVFRLPKPLAPAVAAAGRAACARFSDEAFEEGFVRALAPL